MADSFLALPLVFGLSLGPSSSVFLGRATADVAAPGGRDRAVETLSGSVWSSRNQLIR